MTNPLDLFGEPISSYSRAQAIEDGQLVDVSEQASSKTGFLGGFNIPVAVTDSVWAAIEAIPLTARHSCDDVGGRLHDVLFTARMAANRARGADRVDFIVILPTRGSRIRNRTLRMTIGGDDQGLPCITIGFPEDF